MAVAPILTGHPCQHGLTVGEFLLGVLVVELAFAIACPSDITLGGGFDIVYDASRLSFAGLINAGLGDPAFRRDPDVLPGLLENLGFADFNGLTGPALVGYVQFTIIGAGSPFGSTAATNGIAGPFVSGVDFITLLSVG